MKYYLVRIDENGNHRVQGEISLNKITRLVLSEIAASGDVQYLLPEILLDKVTDTGIKTTVKKFDNLFNYEKKPVEIETDIDEKDIKEKVKTWETL